jgi:hypothetical protein
MNGLSSDDWQVWHLVYFSFSTPGVCGPLRIYHTNKSHPLHASRQIHHIYHHTYIRGLTKERSMSASYGQDLANEGWKELESWRNEALGVAI